MNEDSPKPPESERAEHVYFDEARNQMVRKQLVDRGIRDERVLDAMRRVPRHAFVQPAHQAAAYDDRPLEIGWGQTISQPYIVAYMAELLGVSASDRVLEIGTGCGYAAAVLSLLGASVDTIERHEALAQTAAFRLRSLGYSNVTVIAGDGSLGFPARAPYDRIVVSAAAPQVPSRLQGQLAEGGRLVCPVGTHEFQTIVRISRGAEGFVTEEGIRCMFVPLVGRQGWPGGDAG